MCLVEGCKRILKTRATLQKHTKRAHSQKLFECIVCSRNFPNEEQLIDHSRKRHHNQDSHKCDMCNLVFSKMCQYNRHMRRHRLHVCPHSECYFTSEQYIVLRRHRALMHPKFLKCHHCGKEMRDKARMRRHARSHLAAEGLIFTKPSTLTFSCSLCTTVLSTKGSLKRHLSTMHSAVPKIKKPVKKGKERARRFDKGVPRRSSAARLSSLDVPTSLERELICKDQHSTDDLTSAHILDFVLTGWFNTSVDQPNQVQSSQQPLSSE